MIVELFYFVFIVNKIGCMCILFLVSILFLSKSPDVGNIYMCT